MNVVWPEETANQSCKTPIILVRSVRTTVLAYVTLFFFFTVAEPHCILPVLVVMSRWYTSSLRAKPSLTYVTIKIDLP